MVAIKSLGLAALVGTFALANPIAVSRRADDAASEDSEALLKYLTETNPDDIVFNPVEGMPTLEELDITAREALERRFNAYCLPTSAASHVNAAYACRDYLNSLGATECRAWSKLPGTRMCDTTWNYSRCVTYGTPAGDLFESGSSCADVARAVDWVIGNCKVNSPCNCGVAGRQAAWGNGNLIITVSNSF